MARACELCCHLLRPLEAELKIENGQYDNVVLVDRRKWRQYLIRVPGRREQLLRHVIQHVGECQLKSIQIAGEGPRRIPP